MSYKFTLFFEFFWTALGFVKTTDYMSRGTFWGKFVFEKEKDFFNQFRRFSGDLPAFCEKSPHGVFKTASYVSAGTSWAEIIFLWETILHFHHFRSLSETFAPFCQKPMNGFFKNAISDCRGNFWRILLKKHFF